MAMGSKAVSRNPRENVWHHLKMKMTFDIADFNFKSDDEGNDADDGSCVNEVSILIADRENSL